jgi:hypothetical protein
METEMASPGLRTRSDFSDQGLSGTIEQLSTQIRRAVSLPAAGSNQIRPKTARLGDASHGDSGARSRQNARKCHR